MTSSRRVRTPTVLQMEAAESGAASLGIILGYHDKFIPLEQLRVDCGVSRDGAKAENILTAAAKYGMDAKTAAARPADVWNAPMPAIVNWNLSQFLVVEGADPKRVFVNDPHTGPRTMTHAEFESGFRGTILTFSRGRDYVPGPPKISFVTSLRRLLVGSERALIFLFIVVLGLIIPGIVIPAFAKIFVDDILVGQLEEWIGPLFVAMVVTAAILCALTWLQQEYIARLANRLALTGSSRFVWHLFRLPMEFFSQRTAGDLTGRVESNDRVANLLSGDLATAAFNMINVILFGAIMLTYDASLALIAFATAAINFAILRYMSRLRRDGNQRQLQEQRKLLGTSMAGLQIIETLKATAGESDFFANWAGYQARLTAVQQNLGKYTQTLVVVPRFLTVLSFAIVVWLGALQVMTGEMSMGTLVAFQSLMAAFLVPISNFVEIGTRGQDAEADINQMNDVLNAAPDPYAPNEVSADIAARLPSPAATALIASIEPPPRGSANAVSEPITDKSKLAGYLEMRNVTFGYSRLADPLLVDFSLNLKPGSRVALVGASGSGKSTVAKLVSGLYRPWSGEILLDDIVHERLPRWLVQNSFASVDQEIFLFEGTIAQNLTMWDPTIEPHVVVQAAKDAAIHEIISERAGAYDAQVVEGGSNFSGGQRQRLEIARALVIDPSILILDEATSALDTVTEKQIDDNIRRRGCTTLIIAHRLSTIRDCDEIIVLDHGKIAQRGTHDQLIADSNALYRRLIQAA